MEYKIISAYSLVGLEKLVNNMIEEGFTPIGCITSQPYKLDGLDCDKSKRWVQAMIRKTNE